MSFLALQLADAASNPLELPLSLLPALQRRDDQIPIQLLAHDQVGGIDVIHLLAHALQAILQPQHRLPQVPLRHPVQLVDGLALGLGDYLGVSVDVEDLLDFDLQGKVIFAQIVNYFVVIFICFLAGVAHSGHFFSGWYKVVHACRRNAQVIIEWKPAAVQHTRPGEPKRGHHWCAAVLDALAQRPARLNGLIQVIQTHRSKKRAKELSRVGVALSPHQGDPGRSLLQNFVHGFVSEQVGETHLCVLDIMAQEEVCRNWLAVVFLWEEFMLAKVVQSVDSFHAGERHHPQEGHG